ncbi:MAG: GAF domain-containing protein [Candidatus Rokubacteria bacterium]|nr:GAF domain-containing protein [Candidatus Rokubacteria bacterium]
MTRVPVRAPRSAFRRAGLLEAAHALGTLTGPVSQAIAQGGTRLREAAVCTVRLRDPDESRLRLVASAGPLDDAGDLDREIADTVAATARPLVIPSVFGDPRVARTELWRARGYASWLGVPLPAAGGTLGVLGIALPTGGPTPTREEQHLLEMYALQAALAVRNERLGETIARQVAALEIARAELIETAKVLALGHLVGGVAHEVNNVLGRVGLTIETLLEQVPDSDVQARLRTLDGQYRQIADLMAELRRFSGNTTAGPVDLRAATEQVLRLRQPRLITRNITVEEAWGADVPAVTRGRSILERVILALVLHCEERLAAAGADGRLRVGTESFTREGAPWVALTIEDNGAPVDQAALAHLFDPFTPSDGARGRTAGLTAAHDAVTELGGRIDVSGPGRGLRYRLELPVEALG